MYYDSDADVLYVTFNEQLFPCVYVDSPSGAILRVSAATGELASVTIPFFSRRANSGQLDFPELGGVLIDPEILQRLSK